MSDAGVLSTINKFIESDKNSMPGNTFERKKSGKVISVIPAISSYLFKTSGFCNTSIVASNATSSAIASAIAVLRTPCVDLLTSEPKNYLINSAKVIFFFVNILFPSAVRSLSCFPFLSSKGSAKSLNLLFIKD